MDDGHRSVPLTTLERAAPVQVPGGLATDRLKQVGADRLREGRIVELQRDVIPGLLSRALPTRAYLRTGFVGHAVEDVNAEIRRVLGIGGFGRNDDDVLVQ